MHSVITQRFNLNKFCETLKDPIRVSTRDTINNKIDTNIYKYVNKKCPNCETSDFLFLASSERHNLPISVVLCKKCSLIYNNKVLEESSLHDFYENYCYKLDRGNFSFEKYAKNEIEKGKILYELLKKNDLLSALENSYILEVGFGAGGVLKYFAEQNFDIKGCELSKEMVDFVKNKYQLSCTHGRLQDLVSCLDSTKKIGLIIYEQVLEHIFDVNNELSILHDIVDVNTLIYISVPGLDNIKYHYNNDFLSYLEIDHLIHFSLTTLDALMNKHGFERIYGNNEIKAIYKKKLKKELIFNNYKPSLDLIQNLEKNYEKNYENKKFSNDFRKFYTKIKDLEAVNSEYIVYGLGNLCELLIMQLKRKIRYLISKDESKVGEKLNGISILSINTIKQLKENQKIIISSIGYTEEIVKELINNYQINKDKIISLELNDCKVRNKNPYENLYHIKTGNQEHLKLQIDRNLQHVNIQHSLIHSKYILPNIKKPKDSNILLIGPCNGHEIDAFEKYGFKNIYAIDLVKHDNRITVMDMHYLDFFDDFFDVVYTMGALHCSYNTKKVGYEIKRVLKNKGIAIIGVAIDFIPNEYYVVDFKSIDGILDIFPTPKPKVDLLEIENPDTIRNPHGTKFLKCILSFTKK